MSSGLKGLYSGLGLSMSTDVINRNHRVVAWSVHMARWKGTPHIPLIYLAEPKGAYIRNL